MSFVITTFNVGLINGLFFVWLKAWSIAFAVAYPAILVIAPIAHKLTTLVMSADKNMGAE